jgi:hypothetical protein
MGFYRDTPFPFSPDTASRFSSHFLEFPIQESETEYSGEKPSRVAAIEVTSSRNHPSAKIDLTVFRRAWYKKHLKPA